jgi:anaerobic ribonucleoside-triphosphate reductase activating protein
MHQLKGIQLATKKQIKVMFKKIRLAGIAQQSTVNGHGLRKVFFSQGCSHHCKNCFNPET